MVKYLIYLVLCFYSFNSFANWTHMYQDKKFDDWYIDFTKIQRVNDHVFYQTLVDHNDNKIFPSSISYNQGDCETFEWKITHISFFKSGMAEEHLSTKKTNDVFQKIEKNSILGYLLGVVCNNSLNIK